MNDKNDSFKMPTEIRLTGVAASTVTKAFVGAIIPAVAPTEEELDDALATLGMSRETIRCAYCGGIYSEWDHLRPVVRNKRPTGYFSEIANLVPCCVKCNQSKKNSDWKEWMLSSAKRSPKNRGIPDLEEKVRRLEAYEEKYTPHKLDLEKLVEPGLWQKHWENHQKIQELLRDCQATADQIKGNVIGQVWSADMAGAIEEVREGTASMQVIERLLNSSMIPNNAARDALRKFTSLLLEQQEEE